MDIPKKYNQEAISVMKINFIVQHNLSGNIAFTNNEYYTEEIMSIINKLEQDIKTINTFE